MPGNRRACRPTLPEEAAMTTHRESPRLTIAVALAAAALAACDGGGGGGITEPTPAPTALAALTPLQEAGWTENFSSTAPAVRVTDQKGRPLGGVTVTFTVTAGGGHIPRTQVQTDPAGAAHLDFWYLGAAVGEQTLSASVPGLDPVVFRVAAADPCTPQPQYTLFTQRTATLGVPPCRVRAGHWAHLHPVTLAAAQGLTFTQRSQAIDSYLLLEAPDGIVLAFNDDDEFSLNSALDVIAPAGAYRLVASSFNPGEEGAYTLGSAAISTAPGCHVPWLVPGVETAQSLAATDCEDGGLYGDLYLVVLQQGQRVRISMRSSAVDAFLLLGDDFSGLVAQDDDGGEGTNAAIDYTAPRHGIYIIVATSASPAQTGAYVLEVTNVPFAAVAASAPAPALLEAAPRFRAAADAVLGRYARARAGKR
jgi:hypothetical protein